MNTLHTSGPWRLIRVNKKDGEYRIEAESQSNPAIVCEVAGGLGFNGDCCYQSDANARLICAAPDLLSALRSIVIASDNHNAEQLAECVNHASSLISRVEG